MSATTTPTLHVVSANDLGRTYDCRVPSCPESARSDRGRYAYCDEHRKAKAWEIHGARATGRQYGAARSARPAGPYERRARALLTVARNLDRAIARARDAGAELRVARAAYAEALRAAARADS